MSIGSRIPLEEAQRLARELGTQLEPLVARLQVAGSVRRKRPLVSDIEFVVEPRPGLPDLLGSPGRPDIEPIRRLAETWGRVKRGGERMIGIADVLGTQTDCELYLVHPPAQWGVILAIRTGPAELGHLAVSRMHKYGRRCEDGRIIEAATGNVLEAETEERFFELAGMGCLPPRFRDSASAGAPLPGHHGRPS